MGIISPKGGIMRSYELMAIFRTEEDAYQSAREALKTEITKHQGTVSKEEELGERLLAYPINKIGRGKYVLYNVMLSPDQVTQVSRNLTLNKTILRHLFVVTDK